MIGIGLRDVIHLTGSSRSGPQVFITATSTGRSNQYSSAGSSRPISSSDTWPRSSPQSAPRILRIPRRNISSSRWWRYYMVERVELAEGADHHLVLLKLLYVLPNSQC